MADRLTLAHAIEDAGIERTKAEALAGAILEAIHDNVATKIDIRELRSELKADIQELRSELKADIQELRGEMARMDTELRSEMAQLGTNLRADMATLRAEMATLRADMALVEHRLLTRLGGLIVVLLGLLFAALHAWPPGHG
jgi:pyridoxal biosynthesis lyase PdxS